MGFLDVLFGEPTKNNSEESRREIVLSDKNNYNIRLCLNDNDLSRHLLLLGEHGSGKTNVFYLIMQQIRQMDYTKMVIFDPKGDYKAAFYKPAFDYLISSAAVDVAYTSYWNLFREIEFSDYLMSGKKLTMKEIVNSFFEGRKNQSQPFFSDAAKNLFYMIIAHQMNILWNNNEYIQIQNQIEAWSKAKGKGISINDLIEREHVLFETFVSEELNNAKLAIIINNGSLSFYRKLLKEEFPNVFAYLGESGEDNKAALSVVGEMQAMYFEIFKDTIFEKYEKGKDIAVCNFINNKGGRLFIEYDVATASSLGTIYKILVDLALKTQMSNFIHNQTKCVFILDELRLMPRLMHLENGLNFGRSLGVRIIAGLQSVTQMNEVYGEVFANVILNGFTSLICFSLSAEAESREYVVKRLSQKGQYEVNIQHYELPVVDERRILQLQCGQAICKLYNRQYPFIFHFEEYILQDYDKQMVKDLYSAFSSEFGY